MAKYLFYLAMIIYSSVNAIVTRYDVGNENFTQRPKNTFRNDDIVISKNGGFIGYTEPSSKCKLLRIRFVKGNEPPTANITQTTHTSFPKTLKEIWFEGDATGYDELVKGGRQFAIPTPAENTLIRFNLTSAPATPPLAWFQSDLPAGCWLSIEPGSVDPWVNGVLPLRGSADIHNPCRMLIGTRITPCIGFAALLASAPTTSPLWIQRHPNLPYEISNHAVLALQEQTIFYGPVNGISMDWVGTPRLPGEDYCMHFMQQSDIVNPTESAGQAGFFIETHRLLRIYNANKTEGLPAIYSGRGAGGITNVDIETPTHIIPPLELPFASFLHC